MMLTAERQECLDVNKLQMTA